MAAGRDFTHSLFPTEQNADWGKTLQFAQLEQQHRLPGGTLQAVMPEESGGDPNEISPAGAQGLFQLMPKTAARYQVDPYDPYQAAPAAAKELARLHRKYQGDMGTVLTAWNWGEGNVDRQGVAQAPAATKTFVARVQNRLGGKEPDGATAPSQPGRDLTQDLFGDVAPATPAAPQQQQAGGPPLPPTTPSPPSSTPAASGLDDWRTQQVGQLEDLLRQAQAQNDPQLVQDIQSELTAARTRLAPPAAATPQATTPEWPMDTQVVPNADPTQPAYLLPPGTQEPLTIAKESPDTPLQEPLTIAKASPAAPVVPVGTSPSIATLPQVAPVAPTPPAAPSVASPGVTLPSGTQLEGNMIDDRGSTATEGLAPPGTLGRMATGALKQGATMAIRGGIPTAVGLVTKNPTLTAASGVGANYLTDWLGLTEPEKTWLGIPGATTSNILAVAGPLVPPVLRAGLQRTGAGKAILAAEETTNQLRQEWSEAADAAKQAWATKQTDVYDGLLAKAKDAQEAYARGLKEYQRLLTTKQADVYQELWDKVRAAKTQYDQALQEAHDLGVSKQGQVYDSLWAKARDAQATYDDALKTYTQTVNAKQTQYTQALQGQEQGLATARAIPGRYAPDTPSHILYGRLGQVAKDAPVDMVPVQNALQDILANRPLLPSGQAAPLPAGMTRFVDAIQKAGNTVSMDTVQQELKALGPLTRDPNGNIRGFAKQLYGAYGDAIDASAKLLPETADAANLSQAARASFRKEMALQDVSEMLQPGKGVVRYVNGREAINVDALRTKIEHEIATNKLFRESWTPDELTQFREDLAGLSRTPKMPTGPPNVGEAPPAPELMPGGMSYADERRLLPSTPPTTPPPEALPGGMSPAEGRRLAPGTPPEPPEALPGGISHVDARRFSPEPQAGPEPAAVEPTLTRPPFWGTVVGRHGGGAGITGGLLFLGNQIGEMIGVPHLGTIMATAKVAIPAGQQATYLLSKALLTPTLRPYVIQAMQGGTIDPRFYGVLNVALQRMSGAGQAPALPAGR